MKDNATTVIDVSIDPEENVFPMIPAGMGLTDILLEAGTGKKSPATTLKRRQEKEILVEARR